MTKENQAQIIRIKKLTLPMISDGYLMYILRILLIIVIIYAILISCTTDYMAFDASTVSQCVLPIVMAIVNKVYFDRRKDIFVN